MPSSPPCRCITGPFSDTLFSGIDLIAISPGVPLADPKVAAAIARGIPVAGDVELFALAISRQLSAVSPHVIAITGSNGKSTVTEMAGAMCRAAGLKTTVAGNIGLPVLDALMEAEQNGTPEAFVLELSSFQLETTSSLDASAADRAQHQRGPPRSLHRHGALQRCQNAHRFMAPACRS